MFDREFWTESLQIPVLSLAKLPLDRYNAHKINWTAVYRQVFGVDDVRPRTGPFDMPWPTRCRFTIPDLDQPFGMDLADVCAARANDIHLAAVRDDKRIVIMWSGGIDSTLVCASFIKNLSATDLQRVIICTTLAAIDENPWFYHSQIQGRFDMMHWQDLQLNDTFFQANILLHGDPGDCIFGPSTLKFRRLWQDSQYLKTWRDNLAILYDLYADPQVPTFARWWVDKICANLDHAQQRGLAGNVRTISDWHWWNYFNLRWQGSIMRPFVRNKGEPASTISQQNIQNYADMTFFADWRWQVWSYQNLARLIGPNIGHHKSLAKKYIWELDRNDHYRDTKMKTISQVWHVHRPQVVSRDAVHYDFSHADFLEAFAKLVS